MPPLLGLDIGTYAARAAALAPDGTPFLVQDRYGQSHIPNVVRFTLAGAEAGYYSERFLVTDWENSVRGCTRFIGRYAGLPAAVLADAACPVREVDGRAHFNLLYAEAFPEDLYAHVAAHLVDIARASLGPVADVVLSVPAGADDLFRVRVKTAVEALGLRVRRLVNQPTAAVLAAARRPGGLPDGLLAVADVGGGKTDVSIVRKRGAELAVLATRGDPHLGGRDLAERLAAGLGARFARSAGVDPLACGSPVAALGLRHAAEEAMHELSTAPRALVVLDHGGGFGRDLMTTVLRGSFEEWIAPELARIGALARDALDAAGTAARDLAAVLITGGAAQIPAVRRTLAAAFARRPAQLLSPDPLGLVACGAAVQGGLLTGALAGQVWDVTPYPLGIAAFDEDNDYVLSTIIPANIRTPTAPMTQPYHTHERDQRTVELQVLQCRRPVNGRKILPADCEELGRWTFRGLAPERGGYAYFDVAFAIDADGILTLAAREHGRAHRLDAQVARWG